MYSYELNAPIFSGNYNDFNPLSTPPNLEGGYARVAEIPEPTTYLDSTNIGMAAVLFILVIGLWIYIHAKSKKPKFDRRGHPVHIPGYADIIDLSKFNPATMCDSSIKNDVYDVYDPSTYKLGDTSVFVGYFDGEVVSSGGCPGNYAKMVKKIPIEMLLTHRHTDATNKLRLQYITHLYDDNTEIAKYFAENCIDTLKTLMKKYKIQSREIEDVNIDIHTNPWTFCARFGCVDRWSIVLHGTKRLLLFNVKREQKQSLANHQHYVKYVLNQLGGNSIERAQDHLKTIGIKTQLVTLYPGDLLYLGAGTFFMEDSDLSSNHTITLNLDVTVKQPFKQECKALFDSLWSRTFETLEKYSGVDDVTIR